VFKGQGRVGRTACSGVEVGLELSVKPNVGSSGKQNKDGRGGHMTSYEPMQMQDGR
jgi:hypothetical protein